VQGWFAAYILLWATKVEERFYGNFQLAPSNVVAHMFSVLLNVTALAYSFWLDRKSNESMAMEVTQQHLARPLLAMYEV
jgi:hypothetical protein